jgi:hypothetical protein
MSLRWLIVPLHPDKRWRTRWRWAMGSLELARAPYRRRLFGTTPYLAAPYRTILCPNHYSPDGRYLTGTCKNKVPGYLLGPIGIDSKCAQLGSCMRRVSPALGPQLGSCGCTTSCHQIRLDAAGGGRVSLEIQFVVHLVIVVTTATTTTPTVRCSEISFLSWKCLVTNNLVSCPGSISPSQWRGLPRTPYGNS